MSKIVSVTLFILLLGLKSWGDSHIARVWHGRTSNEKALEYEKILQAAIKKFRNIKGNQGYEMFKDTQKNETQFMVISYWDSKDSIKAYAGNDITKTNPLPVDKDFLINPEPNVTNYEIRVSDR